MSLLEPLCKEDESYPQIILLTSTIKYDTMEKDNKIKRGKIMKKKVMLGILGGVGMGYLSYLKKGKIKIVIEFVKKKVKKCKCSI